MTTELDAIDPPLTEIKLPASGLFVRVLDLKTRQFFRLVKIITRGAGTALQDFRLDAAQSQEEFAGKLVAVVILSIPEAENEAIEFIRSMIEPVGLIEGKTDKSQSARNDELWLALNREMLNPELEDTVEIIEVIVKRESADIQSLGKRLQAMFKVAQKTGQLPKPEEPKQPESTPVVSSEESPEPSISLVPSMAGATL